MPVTVIAEWTRAGDETTIHDEVHRRLGIEADPPAGLIIHTAGRTQAGGFRIYDVWETEDAWEVFRDDRLRPTVDAILAGLPPGEADGVEPPVVSVYELHRLIHVEPVAGRR